MSLNYLSFEQPIADLEAKIEELRLVNQGGEFDVGLEEEITKLREKSAELTHKIFSDLGAWQVSQLARPPLRPCTLDYLPRIFTEFDELAGDRAFADDKAIIGGLARLDEQPVMVIGHQKGRDTQEKIKRNFGMPKPEGYRKALRLMKMAERFNLPIITFIILYRTELSTTYTITNSLVFSELIQELKKPDAFFSFKELTESLPALLPYLAVLWLAAITLLAAKLLIEITTVNKLPQQGIVAPSNELQTRFDALVKQIQLTITPRLFISLKVEVPMAIGWLKPVVLLPANMISGLNNAQLEMLILHELAHIRRHDYLVNFLQTLVEILLFFHPAVLWVSKQMRNEREYCSDDIAVQHCGDAIAYAHTLADTASLCAKAHRHTIPTMAMAASGGDLKQRVIRLVDHHCAPKNNISKWFASATIIFSVLLLSSTQLLTMPLLDIWHNKNPWALPAALIDNRSSNANTDASMNNQQTAHKDTLASNFPNSSIAQQLLTPQEQAPAVTEQKSPTKLIKPNNTTDITKKVVRLSPAKIKTAAINNVIETAVLNKQPVVKSPTALTNEANQFTAQLNHLSTKTKAQVETPVKETRVDNASMVEKAFERTNSNNPYQQALTQLAAPKEYPIAAFEPQLTNISLPQMSETTLKTSTWQNAKQLKSVDPIYPSNAKRQGIEIEATVNFTIGVDGYIKNIEFVHQSKINYFKGAIRSAIKKWRFLPAKVGDKPVESQMSKVFAFSLHS